MLLAFLRSSEAASSSLKPHPYTCKITRRRLPRHVLHKFITIFMFQLLRLKLNLLLLIFLQILIWYSVVAV